MKKFMILILLLTLMLVGCEKKEEYERHQAFTTEAGFDTEMKLIAYTTSEKEFDAYFQMMKEEFLFYHRLFDRFNTYEGINNIKTINDNAGIAPVQVDDVLLELIVRAKQYSEITPYFNITYGAVYEVWHQYREEGIMANGDGEFGEVPSLSLLEEKALLSGWELVEIDETNKTIYLTKPGVILDVGAIGKGYATEKVALTLEANGLDYGIVSGGGNIRTINHKPDGASWDVAIQAPEFGPSSETIDTFSFTESISVVTSGDYQRYYYIDDDTIISHLVNPLTLQPQTTYRSVTVITKDSTLADALSTSFFMMDYEEALSFIEMFNSKYPDNKVNIVWVSENTNDWYISGDYNYMVTSDLKPISKNLNK